MRRRPLPEELVLRVFRVQQGTQAGLSRKRMAASDLARPVWGVRRSSPVHSAFVARLEAYAARLRPDAFLSHSTAARLHGIPLPLRLERRQEVHISVLAPDRAPHASGIVGHSLSATTRIVTRDGLRVTSVADTWRDISSMLTLSQLVAAGDRIIYHRARMATAGELAHIVRVSGRRRGAATMRAALALLDERAESPPESELRVVLLLAGLERPRINYEVVETEAVPDMRVDFAYQDLRFAIEYQGDYHRSKDQWRKDMTRRSRLESRGWYVMEINADDLRNPAELVARIATVLARRHRT